MCQSADHASTPTDVSFKTRAEEPISEESKGPYRSQCCIHLQGKSVATTVRQFAPSLTSPVCADPLFIVITPDYRTDHSSHVFVTAASFEMHLRSSCYNAWSPENVASFMCTTHMTVWHQCRPHTGRMTWCFTAVAKKRNTGFRCLYVHGSLFFTISFWVITHWLENLHL